MKKYVNRQTIGKLLALTFLVIATIVILMYFKPAFVREIILSSPYAEWLYVAFWTFLPIGFFPVVVLALAGGTGFGLLKGSLLTIIGSALNMSLMFLMSRYIFRRPVQHFLYRRYPESKKILSTNKRGLHVALALARLIPLVPYNIENYAFGLTDIRFFDYLWISLITIIPGTLIYVNVGDKLVQPNSWDFVIAIGMMLALVLGTAGLTKYMKPKEAREADKLKKEAATKKVAK